MAFRDLILVNFRRKLFALLLAILVWVTLHFVETKRPNAATSHSSTNAPALHP